MRNIFSYIVYALLWLMSLLPFWLLYIISDFNYIILAYVIRYRKKVIDTNLKNSFPDKTEKERAVIRRDFYHHICDYAIETFKVLNMSEKTIMKRCVVKNPELLDKYYDSGESVLSIMGHYCNWEWLSGYPLWDNRVSFLPIYKPLHNKVMDKLFFNIRSHFGAIPIPKKAVLRSMVTNIRDKNVIMMGFVGDQTPTKKNIQYWTNFLNQDTPVFMGVEKIARKFDIPVFYIKINKVKRGYYVIELELVCESPKETEPYEITEKHTRILEKEIMANPAYWLWSHKRWKHNRINKQ